MSTLANTNNNLSTFYFGDNAIRVVVQDEDLWFVLDDICSALNLTNPSVSVKALDEDERSKFNLGRQGNVNIVNESGMYTLILRCRDAVNKGSVPHQFRKWITGEVIPSIRKNGEYKHPVGHPIKRVIRKREDLSFTKRNNKGQLVNWHVPNRVNSWHESYRIGQVWFDEIVDLTKNNPKEAYDAIAFAGKWLLPYFEHGQELGFMDQVAKWAVLGMLHAARESLPFKPKDLGHEPVEGLQHYFNQVH